MRLDINEAFKLVFDTLWEYLPEKDSKLYYGKQTAQETGQKVKYLIHVGFNINDDGTVSPPDWIEKVLKDFYYISGDVIITPEEWFETNGKTSKWTGRIDKVPVFKITSLPRIGLNKYEVEFLGAFSFIGKKRYYHKNQDVVFMEIKDKIVNFIDQIKNQNN